MNSYIIYFAQDLYQTWQIQLLSTYTQSGHLYKSLQMQICPKKVHTTCEISNANYIINYDLCNQWYIGKISRSFRSRIYEHRFSVLNPNPNRIISVPRQFSQANLCVKHMQFSAMRWLGHVRADQNRTNICRRKE